MVIFHSYVNVYQRVWIITRLPTKTVDSSACPSAVILGEVVGEGHPLSLDWDPQ